MSVVAYGARRLPESERGEKPSRRSNALDPRATIAGEREGLPW